MIDQESVVEYFTQILTLTNQMKNYGEKLKDMMIIDKIMRTLTPRFDHIVITIEQGTNLERMRVEELQGIPKVQEFRLNERNYFISSDQSLQTQTYKGNSNDGGKNKNEKGKWKNKGENSSEGLSNWNQNHNEENNKKNGGKNKGGKKKFNKKRIQCYNCHKQGHFVDECWDKKVTRKEDEAQQGHNEVSDSDDDVLLMETTNLEDDNFDLQYLDIGCSNHMTGHKKRFVNLDEKVKSQIKFVDNSIVTAEGTGKVMIQEDMDNNPSSMM